jgi:hypothetical protein
VLLLLVRSHGSPCAPACGGVVAACMRTRETERVWGNLHACVGPRALWKRDRCGRQARRCPTLAPGISKSDKINVLEETNQLPELRLGLYRPSAISLLLLLAIPPAFKTSASWLVWSIDVCPLCSFQGNFKRSSCKAPRPYTHPSGGRRRTTT